MRKLKGIAIPVDVLVVSVFAAFIIFVLAISLRTNMLFTTNLGGATKSIQVADFAHLAEECFSEYETIKESLLNENHYNKCGLPKGEVVVKRIEGGKKWGPFGEHEKNPKEERFFVSILMDNGEVGMGEIRVKF